MDNIKATYNIDSKEWSFELLSNTSGNEIQIAFCNDANLDIVEFTNIRFGFELFDKSKTILGESFLTGRAYPGPGANWQTARANIPIITEIIPYKHDTTYSLKIWAENNAERSDGEFDVVVPRPTKEYDSWTWDSNQSAWVPPTPRPEGVVAVWHEEELKWVEITDPSKIPFKPVGFNSWIWSEEEQSWVAPVPKPVSNEVLRWDEEAQNWIPV